MKHSILLLALYVIVALSSHAQSNESYREISAGTHYCHHENGNDEWFIYRPDSPTWVILSSVGKTDTDTYVEVYHEGHKNPFLRSDDHQDAQSMVKFVAEPDSTYYIKWRGIYAETGYDWDCIEEDLGDGEHLSTAIEVTDKTMQFELSPGYDVWYKYVCEGDQWLGMESSFSEYEIYQIRGDGLNLIQSAYAPFRYSFSFSPREGEVYYFHWKNEQSSVVDLTWKLTPNTLQEGKSSEMPEGLPIDQQTRFNPQTGLDHWYKFQGDSIGQLKIVDNNNGNVKVEVWEQHSGLEVQVNYAQANWAPDYYYFHFKKDIEYLIRIRYSTGFYFSAEKITTSPGSAKQNPKEVEEGVHYAKTRYNTGEWFRYTPNVTGEVMIATQYDAFAETTIHLLEEASGLLLATDTTENHNEKEGRVVFNAEESVSYLIYIGNSSHSSIDGIYWDLRLNPHFCSAPDLVSAVNTNTLMGNTDYWFEYTASKRSKVSVTASGLVDKEQYIDIEFYRSCDVLIEAGKDAAEIFMNGGEKVLIKTKGHHIDRFYSIVINETEQSTGTKEFPLEVTIGSHPIQVNKEQWFVYYPQSTGKIEIDMPDDLAPMPSLEIYRPHGNSK
ncbi:MAG: hypothetical protein LC643_07765, partial [Bacteroidales bacterium]|nr:hypothetical protein [Bacteroidales bacterium]